jgi:hypothetical protein
MARRGPNLNIAMKMERIMALLAGLALAAPALAQGAPAPQPQGFAGLFTPWSGVNRDSVQAEIEARRLAAQQSAPTASPEQQQRYTQAVSLGERVGRVVRDGDCEEGERMARNAGDFALVRAVRSHCGLAARP